MGARQLARLADTLVRKHGYPADTPVAVVQDASLPTQKRVTGTLSTIGALAAAHDVGPPSAIIVGRVVHALEGEGLGAEGGLHAAAPRRGGADHSD
jgi:siroheme synthase